MFALFALGFPSPPFNKLNLGLPLTITRRLIMQKASGHEAHSNKFEWGWIGGLLDQWIVGNELFAQ